jgi:hypothetical protein
LHGWRDVRLRCGIAITAGKTLSVSNTLTLAGTDSTTLNINAVATLNANTYTPSSISSINISAVTTQVSSWSRVDNIVTVALSALVTPTASGMCNGRLSIPVASNFTNVRDCCGSGSFGETSTPSFVAASIQANVANDQLEYWFVAPNTTIGRLTISASYLVQ